MRFLQPQGLGMERNDLNEIRVRLRNVPFPTVQSVVGREGVLERHDVVDAHQAETLLAGLDGVVVVI